MPKGKHNERLTGMNKVLLNDTLRTMKRTSPRFISIIAIVALGVSFFAGLNATAPDMVDTAKKYYIDSNAADIMVISSAGMTDNDISLINSINGIEGIEGEKFVDGYAKVDGKDVTDIDGSLLSVRAISLDVQKAQAAQAGENDRNYINRPELIEGNWPANENECVVDQSRLSTPAEFQIGAVVSIGAGGSDLTGTLTVKDYTISGIIRTPLYISYERGATTLGSGKLGTFIYVPKQNFTADYYSAVSVKISGSDKFDPYSDEYNNFISPYIDYIESISTAQVAARVEPLKKDLSVKLEESEAKYADAVTKTEQSIAEGKEQVDLMLDMAHNGDEKLAEYKKQYNEKAAEAEEKIDAVKLEHSTQFAAWEEKRNQYNEAKALVTKYSTADVDYKNALAQYNTANMLVNTLSTSVNYLDNLVMTTRGAVNQLNANQDTQVSDIINRFETSGIVGEEVDQIIQSVKSLTAVGTAEEISAYMEPQLQELEEKLAVTKYDLSQAKTELAQKKSELDNAKVLVEKLKQVEDRLASASVELQDAEKHLTSANYDIQLGELEVLSQLSDMKNQINNYETNMRMAKEKADTIESDFEQARTDAYAKLEDAKNQLNSAKNFYLGLDTAKWYVQNRDSALSGFEEYKSTADRTAALSMIFPWVFFLVSAMVCLNSMTRLVDDERTQLGTLKAMGFTNKEIVMKYLVYAFAASVFGSVVGSFLGFALFPTVLGASFGILFDVPDIILRYRFSYALPSILISILVTTVATFIACRKSLDSDASTLMRPKAPRIGKRVWIEKFTHLWNKFDYTTKVTMRNIFRNKKRFILAVCSVYGCTCLLVAAFGLNNSINSTLKYQFTDDDKICRYDMQIVLNGSYDTTITDCKALMAVSSRPEVESSMLEYMKVYDTTSQNSDSVMETYLLVPEDANAITNYINLKSGKKPVSMSQSGALITKKLSKKLKLDVGDNIEINVEDGYKVNVPVAGIVDNYAFHYIYMTKDVYKALFGTNPKYNYIAANISDELTPEQRNTLAEELNSEYEISAISYSSDIQNSFENTLDSIGFIVIVLIISAALLSLIVMYNLSVTNISERVKEIATIKVLGFTKSEVADYIFRENIILTIIGIAFGLLGGIGLHRVVLLVGEVDVVMFGRSVGFMGFIYSAVLAMSFSLILNFALRWRLNKVNMVESLKSIE